MIPEDYKKQNGCWNCSKCFEYAEYPMEQDDEYFCTEDCTELPFTDEERESVFDLGREKPLGERGKLWHKLNHHNRKWRDEHRVQPFGTCEYWDQACVLHSWLELDGGIGCERCGEERYWDEN